MDVAGMDVAGMDVAGCGLCGVAHVDAAVGAGALHVAAHVAANHIAAHVAARLGFIVMITVLPSAVMAQSKMARAKNTVILPPGSAIAISQKWPGEPPIFEVRIVIYDQKHV